MCAAVARDRGEMLNVRECISSDSQRAAINASRKRGVAHGKVDRGNSNFK